MYNYQEQSGRHVECGNFQHSIPVHHKNRSIELNVRESQINAHLMRYSFENAYYILNIVFIISKDLLVFRLGIQRACNFICFHILAFYTCILYNLQLLITDSQ